MSQQKLEKDISRDVVKFLEIERGLGNLTYFVNLEGARRDVRQQVSLKQQGARAGRPDLEIFQKDRVIFIELKRAQGGRLSTAQASEILTLQGLGYEVHVVGAVDGADGIKQIQTILEGN